MTATASIVTINGLPHPFDSPSINPNVMPPSAMTAQVAPGESMRPCDEESTDSGTCRRLMIDTAADNGRLIKKIQRHDATLSR